MPQLVWVSALDVRPGDRLALLLSDAQAFPRVTGWEDRTIDLTRHGLGVHVHRCFQLDGAPWWADEDMTTFSLTGPGSAPDAPVADSAPIVQRERPCPECGRPMDDAGELSRDPADGVPAGPPAFGYAWLCEAGHWFGEIRGQLVPPGHILTVVSR